MSSIFWRDSNLPQIIESRRACDSRICYKAHSHPTYSIGVVDAGQSIFQANFCEPIHLSKGNIILIPAHQIHACNPQENQAWSYQMLHLDSVWLQSIYPYISKQKHQLNDVILLSNPTQYQAFCEFNDILFSEQHIFIKEAALYQLLIQLFSTAHYQKLSNFTTLAFPESFLNCVEHIDANDALVSLTELAELTQLSCFQIIRLFKSYSGFTPHYFQLNLRINRARILLQKQNRISDIAYQLGFSDQSHFQRTFKSLVGVTPQQYQNRVH